MGANKKALKYMIEAEKVTWENCLPRKVFFISRNSTPGKTSVFKKTLNREYEKIVRNEKKKYPVFVVKNNENLEKTRLKLLDNIADLIPKLKYL